MNKLLFIRGLLFHGRLYEFLKYLYYFNKLDKATTSEATNETREKIYENLSISKEMVFYGTAIEESQIENLKDIRLNTSESQLQGLMLGRYFDEHGNLNINKPLEYILLFLSAITLIMTAIWFIKFGIYFNSVQIHSPPFYATLFVVGILSIAPAMLLFYISVYPLQSYFKYRNKYL